MNTGDTFTDSHGKPWVIDAPLGRGSWSRTWALRSDGGATAVLKLPLTAEDFPLADDPEALASASRTVAAAQKHALEDGHRPFLPKLLGTVGEGIILERYGSDLDARLDVGMPLSEVIDLAVRILHQLAHASPVGMVHGNIRPSNIFLDDQGRPVLSDPLLQNTSEQQLALAKHVPRRMDYHPPEAAGRPESEWDTWAICLMLYRSASTATSTSDIRPQSLPTGGLGRVALAELKDAAANRLRDEAANKRFAARATERLGAVLNRGLSAEREPSPPFRFRLARDLLPRLVEVDDLVHPAVESVSKLMLGNGASNGVFEGTDCVEFSITVGTTAGVTAQEDLACGVNLHDLDAQGPGRVRVHNSRFDVKRYPSGRWRFNFTLPEVQPGRYSVRVAFMVKGAESSPTVSEGTFEVRPRPGYVPPQPENDVPQAIPLRHSNQPANDSGDAGGRVLSFSERRAEGPPNPIRPSGSSLSPDADVPTAASTLTSMAERPTTPISAPMPSVVPPQSPAPTTTPGFTSDELVGAAHTTPGLPPRVPVTPQPAVVAVPHVSPAYPEPGSLPGAHTTPPPIPDIGTMGQVADPGLHDYPPPLPSGRDLPSFDEAPAAQPNPLRVAYDWVLETFDGDLFNAGMAAAAFSFLSIVMLIFLTSSC